MFKTRGDLTGKRFGRLVVSYLDLEMSEKTGRSCWYCNCDCGGHRSVRGSSLKNNDCQSCGCIQDEIRSKRNKENAKYNGESKTRLYIIWSRMIVRCEKDWSSHKKDYKDRGITVCEEWHDFFNFKKWALNNNYNEDLSIDRIDNDGNYCPENCRWATAKEQSKNRRTTRLLTVGGITKPVLDWAEEHNITSKAIRRRIDADWPPEKLFLKPNTKNKTGL
jgi:hypothetical protein